MRKLGVYCQKTEFSASMARLIIQSYIDICICICLSFVEFTQSDIKQHFKTFPDAFSSICVILSGLVFLAFPFYGFIKIRKYKDILDWPIIRRAYGAIYEDLKVNCSVSQYYHLLFILRRLLIACLLVLSDNRVA